MTTVWEIPLSPLPQILRVNLAGTSYMLRLLYRSADMGGWIMDIADVTGNLLVCGIPLVTGADLLGQYGYLNFGGQLGIITDGDPDAVPTFDGLGSSSRLLWITEP